MYNVINYLIHSYGTFPSCQCNKNSMVLQADLMVLCTSIIHLTSALLMTYQGPGKEQRACPGKEAAGEVLRQCEGQLGGTGGVEGGTDPCGHKIKKTTLSSISLNPFWYIWRDVMNNSLC